MKKRAERVKKLSVENLNFPNQSGDPIVSVKRLLKEPSIDKYCQICKFKLDDKDKWKDMCTPCYYKKKLNVECLF
jgi:hypothetical protein